MVLSLQTIQAKKKKDKLHVVLLHGAVVWDSLRI